jgi:hypothetical protein
VRRADDERDAAAAAAARRRRCHLARRDRAHNRLALPHHDAVHDARGRRGGGRLGVALLAAARVGQHRQVLPRHLGGVGLVQLLQRRQREQAPARRKKSRSTQGP